MNSIKKIILCLFLVQCRLLGFVQDYRVAEVCDIARVPSSFPVGFALVTQGKKQYVAYYDDDKNMTVASRKLGSEKWEYKVLETKIGWDTHNYVTMKIDSSGYIHVSGNMHATPLVYYRSMKPYDIQTLVRVDRLVGREEDKMTYPHFMNGPNGEFLFHYRHGRSGDGYEIYNEWNHKDQTWTRYLDKPLLDGGGKRNAYFNGPLPGRDKYYHLIWVWRETPDCATNHTLSYARSKDLKNWESIDGTKVDLPLTIEEKSLYVDTVQSGGGLLNTGIRLGFDHQGRVIIGYHKYDKDQNTQLFISRYENGKWTNKQLTNWNFQWIFSGGGSIGAELTIDSPRSRSDGTVVFGFHRKDIGSGLIVLDGKTLDVVGEEPYLYQYPENIDLVKSTFPGMEIRKANDSGKAPGAGEKYVLRWETLPVNRDRKREGILPPPSILQVCKLVRK